MTLPERGYHMKKAALMIGFFVPLLNGVFVLPIAGGETLMMATTTSTDNTGLLDTLAPKFKQETGVALKWTAVGTGKALKLGENCDVDVLFVHAPMAEKQYVALGYGVDRKEVMYNDFVIIGPPEDPAQVKGMEVAAALRSIALAKAPFMSRGDQSGTNKKERLLWNEAGLCLLDKEAWYIQTGQGMIKTIIVAEERKGYTLTDRGTYIKYAHTKKGSPPLVILVAGDKRLFNQYSVIAVNPKRCRSVRYDLATRFGTWVTSAGAQKTIGSFRLLGKSLFTPNAKK